MRLVHLSDIHLSKDNYSEFHNNYRNALINDLKEYNNPIPIDLILITGDLVDKGGVSLLEIDDFKEFNNPYDIFEKVFIEPICDEVGLAKHQFLFVPGNHDIDESEILWIDEKRMRESINENTIDEYLKNNNVDFNGYNGRIKNFKEFEQKFHIENSAYNFSNNQSTFIYQYNETFKVGFLLINWCYAAISLKLA